MVKHTAEAGSRMCSEACKAKPPHHRNKVKVAPVCEGRLRKEGYGARCPNPATLVLTLTKFDGTKVNDWLVCEECAK